MAKMAKMARTAKTARTGKMIDTTPSRDRIRARRPILSRIAGVVRDVAVGSPRPEGTVSRDPGILAPYRKLLAVPLGALLVWAGAMLGVDLGGLEPVITTALIGYFVWRFPNIPSSTGVE